MTGRVAIVSGGTGALGRAVSGRLLSAGAVVCVPYAVESELGGLRAGLDPSLRSRLDATRADVTDERQFGEFVRGVLDRHRRVDVLVNGVGGFAGGDLASTSLADWQRMLTLNLTSAFVGCRGVLPAMMAARSGRIINIASRAVIPPMGGIIAYTVSKAGVITLTQALAQEVRQHGITVNAVLPSTMDTPANRSAMPDADRSGWVSPASVAEVIAFLASDQAAAVSGAAIPV
ncbi:MAG TPA: SDR family NAD(P)-dependent oxidoreductase [Methylomirabilota bacterium]|nr:SDR family NAD(P)-dependent oxidoreductase [Methylomirabilota bacterium]